MTNSLPTNLKATRWVNVVLATIFMILLWLPTFDTLFHFDRTPNFNEKRLPAPFPHFEPGSDGFKEYLHGLESYYNDHFGCRNQLIHWHIQLRLALFNSGSSVVLMGKDGWLYVDGDQEHMAENFQGLLQFSPQELAELQNLLESHRDWLAQRGIEYIFIVAPNKESIYPEYLPSWLTPVRHYTKLDQFIDYMHGHSTVTVLDLRPALRAAKRTAPTYYKTDSHWNDWGGFVACQEIGKTLAKSIPNLQPLSLDAFDLKTVRFESGDLARMLGVVVVEDDATPMPKTNLPVLMETSPNPKVSYPIYFTGNTNATRTCIVFRDSFGEALKPYLGCYFKQVCYIPERDNLNTNLIEGMKPDVVISEMVERGFDNLDQWFENTATDTTN
jgi:alginate O-acetyltransferase complex protein AlgJ